jgi:hypothetical protein
MIVMFNRNKETRQNRCRDLYFSDKLQYVCRNASVVEFGSHLGLLQQNVSHPLLIVRTTGSIVV